MSQSVAVDLVQMKRFGRYKVVKKLGSGGMGEVYQARDLALGRAVALKVLRGSSLSHPERLARFEQEARAASALNHPNIVAVYDIGTVDDIRYIAMELVEGRTLREVLRDGIPLTRRTLQLAAQAAEGLAQAHAAGIVHRDLKPENIMVAEARVKILDFGLAKLETGAAFGEAPTGMSQSAITEPGRVLGTVDYMSPEQATGQPLDFRSDQFACGAILYEMVTGRPAFRRATSAQTLAAIIQEEPSPIADLNPAVPPPLRWIIERCLAKDPAERYASTRDLARDLENVLSHLEEVSPRSAGSPSMTTTTGLGLQRLLPKPLASRRTMLLAVLAVLGLAALAWVLARREHPPPAAAVSPHLGGRRSVAVLGFRNLSGKADTAWLSTALAEMLTTELAAGGRLRTIPGENVGRMKLELSLSDAESLAADTLARVGRNLGTDIVLLGSYVTLPGDQVRLDLRLQDVATGETIASLAESGTETGLVDLVTRTGSHLRAAMRLEASSSSDGALAAAIPSTVEAQRLYAEGLGRLRVLDALGARNLLEKAVAADPNAPMVRLALADAWAALGYDARAGQETRKAFELSAGLAREERLAVEGRHRERSGDRPKAVAIYAALFAFRPDDVEYGLLLAAAQNTAGETQPAFETLARMRSLSPAGAEDPRIDLTEAEIAHSVGDFTRERAAAARAADEGTARGAWLLVARAKLREGIALDRLGRMPEAARAAEEARRIYAEAGDRRGVAQALNSIGGVSWTYGDLEKTRTSWQEALAIRRVIGDRSGVAHSLHNLGLLLRLRGDLAGARSHINEAYSIDRELGARPALTYHLEALSDVLLELGDSAGALKAAEEGVAVGREIGDQTEAALALMRLAFVLYAQGDLRGALAHSGEAFSALRNSGARNLIANALYELGEFRKAGGDLVASRKHHEEARAIRAELQSALALAESRVALASVALEEGHPEAAEPLLRSAIAVFAAQTTADWEASAQALLGRSLLASRPPEAHRALDRAILLAASSQSLQLKLRVAAAAAAAKASAGSGDGLRELDAGIHESARRGLVALNLELRLARGEIGVGRSQVGASDDLHALAADARARGFELVARKADTLVTTHHRAGTPR